MSKKPKIPKSFVNDPNIIKNPTTKNQKLWNDAYIRAINRTKKWPKNFHAVYTDIPSKPKTIRKKDIEKLESITWKKISRMDGSKQKLY